MAGHDGGGAVDPVVRPAAAARQLASGGAPGPVLHVPDQEACVVDVHPGVRAAEPGGGGP